MQFDRLARALRNYTGPPPHKARFRMTTIDYKWLNSLSDRK